MTRKIALAALAAALVVPAAPAFGVSPIPDGVDCHLKVKKSYKLADAAKHGLAVKVTCTGAASFRSGVDFTGKADETFNSQGTVGLEGGSNLGTLDAAGTATIRVQLAKYAIRRAKELKVSGLRFLLVVKREDGNYWSIPRENSKSKIVNPARG